MSDWGVRTRVTVTHEWVLPNPTNGTQTQQVLSAIRDALSEAGQQVWDDTIRVEGRDEEIVAIVEAAVETIPGRVPMENIAAAIRETRERRAEWRAK